MRLSRRLSVLLVAFASSVASAETVLVVESWRVDDRAVWQETIWG